MKRIVNALLSWGRCTCTVLVLCAATAIGLRAQTFTTLHSFDGTDGADPWAGLVQGTDGNFYGTTSAGGNSACTETSVRCGTVFKVTPSGEFTTLHFFCPESSVCPYGAVPEAPLALAPNGDLIGSTNPEGTVFKITPSGRLTTVATFEGPGLEDPSGPLVLAANGDIYGTTGQGGANNSGTVFKITLGGTLTTLYNFCSQSGCTDGQVPTGLYQATNGDLYGTTFLGGINGAGTVFKITPGGTLTTLHRFCSQGVYPDCPDGSGPSWLIEGADGDFYGTTQSSGANHSPRGIGPGTVFKMSASGALTTLYSFCSQVTRDQCTDGAQPTAGLVEASDGNFYGTTDSGGDQSPCDGTYDGPGCGTIFRITAGGVMTKLYTFCGLDADCTLYTFAGSPYPYAGFAGLLQATNGDFYGATFFGGNTGGDTGGACGYGCGTLFSLSVGLRPFVKTQPHFGAAGAAITILGTDLTGSTSVTFNGTPAAFTIVSATEITTTVPAAATTGEVQVTTPGGTLASGGPFLVAP